MHGNWIFWVIFNVFVLAVLALDLGVFHRKQHVIGFREAMAWTGLWVGLAAVFAVFIYFFGHTIVGSHARPNSQLTLEFVTGYIIEQSLSVDNLFVFLLIFRYFSVPQEYQHGVLTWGVVGALIMRAIFIVTGVELLDRFHWIIYVFGAILVYSGFKLMRQHGASVHPEKNPLLRLFRRVFRVTPDYHSDSFFVSRGGLWYATPLALVLVVVETTDVLFAVDSIPGGAGRHPRAVHRLHVERLRHHGTALAVLCAGGHAGPLPPAALWAVGDSGADWREDADLRVRRHPHGVGAGGGCGGPDCLGGGVADLSKQATD